MAGATDKIPVSVVIATRNEERRIERCLAALRDFAEIIVLDSRSEDGTKEIAWKNGANVYDFFWNGKYPKKRQWALENIPLTHDRAFFVDADEIVTPALAREIAALDFRAAGYFVPGRYIFEGKPLRFGLRNNKLALFDRNKMEFPAVDDLDIPGMGEIEGHYQPVLKPGRGVEPLGQLKNFLLHDAYDDPAAWKARHERYAAWEIGMDRRGAWPPEPKADRRLLKAAFKSSRWRPEAAFLHSYFLKGGFLDGGRGFRFARSRYGYYRMISKASKRAGAPS